MINGAGDGVGLFAVQIAKYYEAEVTAVGNTMKLDMLHSIGADHVIDYTREDFTKNGQRYDMILDIAGYHSIIDNKRALTPSGAYFMVGGSRSSIFQAVFLGAVISMTGKKKMGLIPWKPNKKEDMDFIRMLIEFGKVRPVIDRRYPLNEVAEALWHFEKGTLKGK